LTIEINVISNSDLSSTESNLDINNTYDSVNDNSSTTNFKRNNSFNFEAVLLSSESQGRGRRRGRGRGHPQTKILKKINKLKLILTQTFHTSIIHAWVLTKLIFSLIKIQINAKLICDGVKIFSFCEAKNGYLYAFLVYDGA
jgi:hypothetical protein